MTQWLVILAGPNGAGKSTFVSKGIIHRAIETPESPKFEILNPDAVARELAAGGPVTDELNIDAAQRVEAELERSVAAGQSIGIETVLSSPKYRSLVERALSANFRFMLHYIVLARPGLHVGRVAQRVSQGGHHIPAQKIEDRSLRSLSQLPWFAARATRAFVWDNSLLGTQSSGVQLIAEKDDDGWIQHAEVGWMHPKIGEALELVLKGKAQ